MRAIDHGLRFGAHGLPLMGCGDWNDGMNLVGQHGQGESVWLASSCTTCLSQFAALAGAAATPPSPTGARSEAAALRAATSRTHAWDGSWYRRAYFDDGTPLGSAGNDECQIDSICAELVGALRRRRPAARGARRWTAVDARLVRRDAGLIQLLDPPFDKSDLEPGYIKGYVPGVRENGGQYTHAAIWTAMAFAALGDSRARLGSLFT